MQGLTLWHSSKICVHLILRMYNLANVTQNIHVWLQVLQMPQ